MGRYDAAARAGEAAGRDEGKFLNEATRRLEHMVREYEKTWRAEGKDVARALRKAKVPQLGGGMKFGLRADGYWGISTRIQYGDGFTGTWNLNADGKWATAHLELGTISANEVRDLVADAGQPSPEAMVPTNHLFLYANSSGLYVRAPGGGHITLQDMLAREVSGLVAAARRSGK